LNFFLEFIRQHKNGDPVGIYSVCSAHPLVIEASLLHAQVTNTKILIEATSNQVNQDGGYTGMRPADFCARVYEIADRLNFPRDQVLFGGDHLGPNCWTDLSADAALAKSIVLIDEYVRAGFRKIHLDCSMSCKDDPVPLSDDIVAERAALLCLTAENAWNDVGGPAPVYIIGTEVPVPGGAQEELDTLAVTSADAAKTTIEIHKERFTQAGLDETWSRVIGLVVQPGVEFDHHKVIDYRHDDAVSLSRFIEDIPNMVFEAHSTDYQTAENLSQLVADHFAILKVGPGLTYALREALWALDDVERAWLGTNASGIKKITLEFMRSNPKYWEAYYEGDDHEIDFACSYSLSDRIRYYWPEPTIEEALTQMIENLDNSPPPLTLLSQYMPHQYHAIRQGRINSDIKSLIIHHISLTLADYSDACHGTKETI